VARFELFKHSLLTCLSDATKIIKKWPSSEGDNPTIHYDTTTKLIESLHKVVQALKRVEDIAFPASKDDSESDLTKRLRQCQVPLDLLDFMDYGGLSETGFGLNPDCFNRGLLKEALRQLAGLRRRKSALEILGDKIESGIKKRDKSKEGGGGEAGKAGEQAKSSKKRDIEELSDDRPQKKKRE